MFAGSARSGSPPDDDPDAAEQLSARLKRLMAERARIAAYNGSCRRGAPAPALLDDRQRESLVGLAKFGQLRPNGAMPAYAAANLSGRISSVRARIARLEGK